MPDNKLFQIYHADLAELERVIPDIAEALMVHLSGRQKTQLRRVQAILSNVRWNYGPPSEVEVIDAVATADDDDSYELPIEDDDGDDAIICPWCGIEHDPIDVKFPARHDTAHVSCDSCGKPFTVTKTVLIGYETERDE